MMKIFTRIFLLCLIGIPVSQRCFSQAGWVETGNGTNLLNANGFVRCVATDAAGNVYTAGSFRNAANKYYVARWNGSTWQELGNLDATSHIYALTTDAAGNVYAAGSFFNASFKPYVAKWDGTSWQEVGSLGANASITQLVFDKDGNLYAAGSFTNTQGKYVLMKWNGTTWQEMGAGFSQSIYVIGTDKFGNMYTSGGFTNTSGRHYVAKWNGASWEELGTGTNSLNPSNSISSIVSDSTGTIYVAGSFNGVNLGRYVARWNGTNWQPVGTGAQGLNGNDGIVALYIDAGNRLHAAGNFTDASGKKYVARWTGNGWVPIGPGSYALSANAGISKLIADVYGNLYASGGFTNTSGQYYLAKYSTQQPPQLVSFSPLAAGAGKNVIIKGYNFTTSTQVSFNGVPANSFQVLSDSIITVKAPQSATGKISIQNAYGSGSTALDFMYRPSVDSFAPAAAKMNETVTLYGSGFSSIPSQNFVFFGKAKAMVIAAADTSLTVKVPAGASYAPVSVTNGGFTGYSYKWFQPTFISAPLTSKSFRYALSVTGQPSSSVAEMYDLDDDGKPEIISTGDSVSIFRNTGVPGNIFFQPGINISKSGSNDPAIADMDGDGKPDILTAKEPEFNVYRLNVLRNTSSLNNLSFAETDFPAPGQFARRAIEDLDGDGKPDLVALDFLNDKLVIYRNISTPGNINLQAPFTISLPNGSYTTKINVADLDGDGKMIFLLPRATGIVSLYCGIQVCPGR